MRLGGAQITHDFTMRPDLVTFPLPSMAGSVSVPSTVDVLVNGAQVLSRQVQPGPFDVPQLPVITGAGQVQLTVTNALGQQVTTTLPFYASANLLAPGLHTYSLEAGFVRLNWGVVSNDYGAFAASGTYRRGLTDDVTVEAHAEGTQGPVHGRRRPRGERLQLRGRERRRRRQHRPGPCAAASSRSGSSGWGASSASAPRASSPRPTSATSPR